AETASSPRSGSSSSSGARSRWSGGAFQPGPPRPPANGASRRSGAGRRRSGSAATSKTDPTRIPFGPSAVYRWESMAPISVTLARRDPEAAVVALVGEHDAYSSQRLENELTVLLDEGLQVVVDLRDASFIDSTTLGVLLAERQRAERAGLGFTLVLPRDEFAQVHQILELTQLG